MPASSPPVRYSVCLIASTFGSRAACATNASTVAANESYGMVQQHVAVAHRSEHVDVVAAGERGRRLRRERRVLQLGSRGSS